MTTTNGEAQLEFDLRETPAANNLSILISTFAVITGLRRYGRCLMGRVPGFNSIRNGSAVQWHKSVLSRENRCSYVDNTSANLSNSGTPQSWWQIPNRLSCRWGGILSHSRRKGARCSTDISCVTSGGGSFLGLFSGPCGLTLLPKNPGSGCAATSSRSVLVKETTLALKIFPGDKVILT